jgi:hypothetical protein
MFRSGGRLRLTSTSVVVVGKHLPARMKNGTPSQRHESTPQPHGPRTSRRSRIARDAFLVPVALELAAHQVLGAERPDRAEHLHLLVAGIDS